MVADEQRVRAVNDVRRNYKIFDLSVYNSLFSDDKEFLKEVLDEAPMAIRYASTRLKQDKELVLQAVKKDGLVLKHVSAKLIQDIDVCKEAVKQNPKSVQCMHWKLKSNASHVLELIKANPEVYFQSHHSFHNVDMMSEDVLRAARPALENYSIQSNKSGYQDYVKAIEKLNIIDREDREKELLSKLADLDKLQAQQQNFINQPKAAIKARRKV